MHGPGNSRDSFGGIRNQAIAKVKVPAQGGDDKAYLNAFLDVRRAAMKKEQGHQDTSRVDTLQRKFLNEGNLSLAPPLTFKVYGDDYRIDGPSGNN
jgi:chitosanase